MKEMVKYCKFGCEMTHQLKNLCGGISHRDPSINPVQSGWLTRSSSKGCGYSRWYKVLMIYFIFVLLIFNFEFSNIYFYKSRTHFPLGSLKKFIQQSSWSKLQLQILLNACGDVERNPGPIDDHPTSLLVWQFNIRSWNSNGFQLSHRMCSANPMPDVVLVQESWLNSKRNSPKVQGYTVFRKDRTNGDIGGGLLTFVRNIYSVQLLNSIDQNQNQNDTGTEVLRVVVAVENHHIVFSNIYRPPGTRGERYQSENILSACLQVPDSNDFHHVLAGDFNAHNSLWDSDCSHDDTVGLDIVEWVEDNGFSVVNSGSATYFCSRTQRHSALDLAFISSKLTSSVWYPMSSMGSDHLPVRYRITLPNLGLWKRKRDIPRRSWSTRLARRIDSDKWREFNFKVRETLITNPLSNNQRNNLVKSYSRLQSGFKQGLKGLPKGCRKDPIPWYHPDIDRAIQERERLRQFMSRSEADKERWVEASKEVVETIRLRRREAWREFVHTQLQYTQDPQKTARVIRNINREQRMGSNFTLFSPNGKRLDTDSEKAKAFLNVFAKVSSKDHSLGISEDLTVQQRRDKKLVIRRQRRKDKGRVSEFSRYRIHQGEEEAYEKEFSMVEMESVIQKLQANKAPGKDAICNRILLHMDQEVKSEVLRIINLSWRKGKCPSQWCSGVLIPILKPGKPKSELASYRPVCLTSNLAKLVERMVCARLRYWLESNKKLQNNQSGFRRGRSTMEPLVRIVESIHQGFQKKLKTGAVLIDLSRAFDKVDHLLLLLEFGELGIPSIFGRWFHSFLTDRKYSVRFGTCESHSVRFALGVPQGSVSGPLLFIIFMDSLCRLTKDLQLQTTLKHLFADDISLFASCDTLEGLIKALEKLVVVVLKWSMEKRMPVSVGKNDFIVFSLNSKDFITPCKLKFGSEELTAVDKVRLLGVWLDRKLLFMDHINKIIKDCSFRMKQMMAVTGMDWGSSARDLRALYLAYVRSVILYGSAAFGSSLPASRWEELQILERKFLRMITGASKATRTGDVYLEANVMPIVVWNEFSTARLIEKYRRFQIDDPMYKMMVEYNPTRSRLKKIPIQVAADRTLRESGIDPARLTKKQTLKDDQIKHNIRLPISMFPLVPPWDTCEADKILFFPFLSEEIRPADSVEEKKRKAMETLKNQVEEYGPLEEVWTDGACENGLGRGAAAYTVNLTVRLSNGVHVTKEVVRDQVGVSNICDAYHTEAYGILSALLRIQKDLSNENNKERSKFKLMNKSLRVCTDSQSVVRALKSGPLSQDTALNDRIWKILLQIVQLGVIRVIVQWVPGHVGILKNEIVDGLANQALKMENLSTNKIKKLKLEWKKGLVSYGCLSSVLRQAAKEKWNSIIGSSDRIRLMSNVPTDLRLTSGFKRAEEVLLTHIRTGKCPSAGSLWRIIHNKNQEPLDRLCRGCHREEESTVHLLLDCSQVNVVSERSSVWLLNQGFQNALVGKDVSAERLKQVVKFFNYILSLL